MKILKTLVGSGSSMFICSTIEYKGGIWLVPHWLEDPAKQVRMPVRIVRMDLLKHQRSGMPGWDYMLNAPVPMSVLDGVATIEQGVQYEVIESPPIQIPIQDQRQH